MLNELRRYHDALASYDKALALVPDLTEAWLGRGNILNMLKQSEEALGAFDRALKFHRNLAEAWLGRGNAFCERNDYDNAATAYDRALALNANLAEQGSAAAMSFSTGGTMRKRLPLMTGHRRLSRI